MKWNEHLIDAGLKTKNKCCIGCVLPCRPVEGAVPQSQLKRVLDSWEMKLIKNDSSCLQPLLSTHLAQEVLWLCVTGGCKTFCSHSSCSLLGVRVGMRINNPHVRVAYASCGMIVGASAFLVWTIMYRQLWTGAMGGLSGKWSQVCNKSSAALHLDRGQRSNMSLYQDQLPVCILCLNDSDQAQRWSGGVEQHVKINAPAGNFHQMMQKHAIPHKSH